VTPAAALAVLDSLDTVRERCARITQFIAAGESRHFLLDRGRLDAAADATIEVTRRRYPALAVPYHSRWRHFTAGGIDRKTELDAALRDRDPADVARAHFDLATIGVLLDAGAGPQWRYVEDATQLTLTRSEGLGVATLRAFLAGAFSATPGEPARVDAAALATADEAMLSRVFQVAPDNRLVGLAGRAALLRRLAHALEDRSRFAAQRPGAWFDALTRGGAAADVDAADLFAALRHGLRDVLVAGPWPGAGDCWPHPAATAPEGIADGVRSPALPADPTAGFVPLHKLTQWLAYSLCEPLEWAGVRVTGLERLTGLPEYRNGGLLLDTGVLRLRDPGAAAVAQAVGGSLCVEWRAATVTLLDEVATRVRHLLDRPDMPLAAILEGGTWAAGRALAARLRGGAPPLTIASDGTVF